MDDILRMLSEQSGLSLSTTTLLLGAIFGFLLGKVGRPRVPERTTQQRTIQPSQFSQRISSNAHSSIRVSLNGQEMSLDPQVTTQIQDLIRDGKTIEAIKKLREVTNLDLKTAKDLVEHFPRR